MVNITLVGTVHSDFRGPKRLMTILGFYRNPVIVIESTEGEVEEAKGKLTLYKKFIEDKVRRYPDLYTPKQVSDIRAYVDSYCYESNVPYNFQSNNNDALVFPIGIEVENLDKWTDYKVQQYLKSGKDQSRLIGHVDPSIEDLLKNGLEFYQKVIDKEYDEDSSSFMQHLMGEIFPFVASKRDELFAKKIMELRKVYSEREIVGIFGNMHIFGTYGDSLYNQLRDLNPIRCKLKEADMF